MEITFQHRKQAINKQGYEYNTISGKCQEKAKQKKGTEWHWEKRGAYFKYGGQGRPFSVGDTKEENFILRRSELHKNLMKGIFRRQW